jgi:hypothetical protein
MRVAAHEMRLLRASAKEAFLNELLRPPTAWWLPMKKGIRHVPLAARTSSYTGCRCGWKGAKWTGGEMAPPGTTRPRRPRPDTTGVGGKAAVPRTGRIVSALTLSQPAPPFRPRACPQGPRNRSRQRRPAPLEPFRRCRARFRLGAPHGRCAGRSRPPRRDRRCEPRSSCIRSA